MIPILALSVLGSWTYAGFLADPTPNPSALTDTNSPPASAPLRPEPKKEPAEESSETSPVAAQASAKPPQAPQVSFPPKTTLYRSTDAHGQAWDHPDPAYLANFVEARNRSFVTSTYAPPPPARPFRCANGRCY